MPGFAKPGTGGHPLAIAILGYGCALDALHREVGAAFGGRAGVEDLGDVRVVHQRERLAPVGETSEYLTGVHPELHYFEGHIAANGSRCSARYMVPMPRSPISRTIR
jgi:hypothetical protein